MKCSFPTFAAVFLLASAAQAQQTPTIVAAAEPTPTVVVTGKGLADTPLATGKTDLPLIDVPQTVVDITDTVAAQEAAFDITSMIRTDPSVSIHAPEDSSNSCTEFYIRGLNAENQVFVNGLRTTAYYCPDAFDIAALNIYTGPSSVKFGFGSTGGIVAMITKTPSGGDDYGADLSFSTDGTKRLTASVDHALSPNAALRVDGVITEAEGAQNVVFDDRVGFAPSFSWHDDDNDLIVLVHAYYQQDNGNPGFGQPWIDFSGTNQSHPATVPSSNYYGFSDNYLRTAAFETDNSVTYHVNDWLVLSNNFLAGNYYRAWNWADATVPNVVPAGTPLQNVTATMTALGGTSTESDLDDNAGARFYFNIGPVKNDVLVGLDLSRNASAPEQFKWSHVPGVNLLYPGDDDPFSGKQSVKSIASTRVNDVAPYVIGETGWDPFILSWAYRIDHSTASYVRAAPTPLDLSNNIIQPSYNVALTWRIEKDLSAYFTYGTSFDPQFEGLSLSASSAILAPTKNNTKEIGVKWDLHDRLMVSADLFDITVENAKEAIPTDPSFSTLVGTEVSRGGEILVSGKITHEWAVNGGVTYDYAEVTQSPNGDLGNPLQNAPKWHVALWTTYDVPAVEGLTVGGGMQFMSSRYASSTVDGNGYYDEVPGYVTGSLMAAYQINPHIAVQANIDNISNTSCTDGLDNDHVLPCEGTTGIVAVHVRY